MRRRTFCLVTMAATMCLLIAAGPAMAAFPGTNGLIAFVRDGDIHTMTPEGRDVRRAHPHGRRLLPVVVRGRRAPASSTGSSRAERTCGP